MIKVISFDMDGTLVRKDYVDHVWLEIIPTIYAKKKDVDFEKAKKYIEREYMKVGEQSLEWYDIKYWLKKLDLNYDWKKLLRENAYLLKFYPEVPEVLDRLGKNYELVIISNAAREFIKIEAEALNLSKKFGHIFSAVTDFGQTKKNPSVYKKICQTLDVEKGEIVHIGDSWEFDYLSPLKAGITSFYLDREEKMDESHAVKNLKEFEEKLLDEEKRWMN